MLTHVTFSNMLQKLRKELNIQEVFSFFLLLFDIFTFHLKKHRKTHHRSTTSLPTTHPVGQHIEKKPRKIRSASNTTRKESSNKAANGSNSRLVIDDSTSKADSLKIKLICKLHVYIQSIFCAFS